MSNDLNYPFLVFALAFVTMSLGAWALMVFIAIACNVLVGYGARSARGAGVLLLILPLIVAVAFELIADIDSPRAGVIHVVPQNLRNLLGSLPAN
jgi:hypothetical protein